mmetsp:Transcript_2454/g.5611  ORF Transcript_2454/g.5611 Transcript_2454/m.5611 type:complete len:1394 (-) Transcript_2454:333-4514(-)
MGSLSPSRKEHKHKKERKEKDKDRERDRRDRDRGKERYKDSRGERERDRDRDYDRERERGRESSKHGSSSRAGDLGRSSRRHRSASKSRERSRSPKRARTAGSGEAARSTASPAPVLSLPPSAAAPAPAGVSAEEAAQQRRESEAADLDAEIERRRLRVEEWRAKRAAAEAENAGGQSGAKGASAAPPSAAANGPAGQADGPKGTAGQQQQQQKGGDDANGAAKWTLEDEEEDEAAGVAPQGQGTNANGGADNDEDDPLDAFMAGNARELTREEEEDRMRHQQAAQGAGDEEEDPLDAFMAATVMPKVVTREEDIVKAEQDVDMAEAHVAPKIKKEEGEEAGGQQGQGTQGMAKEGAGQGTAAPGEQHTAGTKGGGRPVKTEPSVKGEPGEPPPSEAGQGGSGVSAVASKGFVGANAGMRPVGALSSAALTGKPGLAAFRKRGGAVGMGAGRRRMGLRAFGGGSSSESSGGASDDDEEGEKSEDDAEWARNVTSGKLSKGDRLGVVDHSKVNYGPFRKNFYIEVAEIARMSDEEVVALRKELDGIKVRGSNVPKPVKAWTQAGLSSKLLDILRKEGFEKPLPIQAQTLPIIMSGRDCIGIAKTGSGKTLAFVLPMLRHIKDQPPLMQGDGPIGLIMAPTRELVQQISKEARKFARPLGLECTAVYGGSGVANQITELKRGTEIVACTPGRMIDLLVTSGGKITNLRRVTFLVMDEADRMFDMGFEPQIMRILHNIRPDRQTVMFSATFPKSVEILARKVLVNPCEILVGGRSIVNPDITQIVEIRPEEERFLRLLEILGEWYEKGKLIIFVGSQEKCDTLFRDLLKAGYPCLSLHGGKDQSDRECTITDFKGAVCNILVATGIAARGLDVKELVLVVNYDTPNHHEEYVHRVGRTGRAGNKGTAITFINPEDDKYAPDLVKALQESKAPVPQDLELMAASFAAKRKAGLASAHGSGYGGTGFKFDREEADKTKQARKEVAKGYGYEDQGGGSDSSDDEIRVASGAAGEGGEAPPESAQAIAVAAVHAAQAKQRELAAAQGKLPQAQLQQQQQPQHVPRFASELTPGSPAALQFQAHQQHFALTAAQQQAQMALAHQEAAKAAAAALGRQAAASLPALSGGLHIPSASTPAGTLAPPASTPAGSFQPQPMQTPHPQPGSTPAPAINPAVLIAQQVAARLAAGGPPPGSTPPPMPATSMPSMPPQPPQQPAINPMVAAALASMPGVRMAGQAQAPTPTSAPAPSSTPPPPNVNVLNPHGAKDAVSRAAALAMQFATKGGAAKAMPGEPGAEQTKHYEAELEINDFPQHSRWKVTHRDTVNMIGETTGAALITKGVYVPPGKQPPEGERKIYLLIEGPTELSVKHAKQALKQVLEETTEKVMRRDAPAGPGKYSIV